MRRRLLIGLVVAVAVALATVAVAASGGAAHDRAASLTAAATARRALTTSGLQARLDHALSAFLRTQRLSKRPRKSLRSRPLTVVVPPTGGGMSCAVSGGGGCSLTPCLYFVPATTAATATVGPGRRAPASGATARRTRPRCRAPRKPTRPILS
jgi:hypothetical protein